MKLDRCLPTEGTSGFRTAGRNFVFLAAQGQAPDSQPTQLEVDEEIHARRKALFASEGRLGP